jgi:hypothetical protein
MCCSDGLCTARQASRREAAEPRLLEAAGGCLACGAYSNANKRLCNSSVLSLAPIQLEPHSESLNTSVCIGCGNEHCCNMHIKKEACQRMHIAGHWDFLGTLQLSAIALSPGGSPNGTVAPGVT